jgi:hypothetical protein
MRRDKEGRERGTEGQGRRDGGMEGQRDGGTEGQGQRDGGTRDGGTEGWRVGGTERRREDEGTIASLREDMRRKEEGKGRREEGYRSCCTS